MSRRMFVAAWLDEAARREAADLLERLRSSEPAAPVKWVSPENLHVTLRFLGDVAGDRVDDLVRSLDRFLEGAARFEYRLEGVGTFPSLPAIRSGRAPRVLWAGLERGGRELAALAPWVERAAMEAGAIDSIDDRPFRSHVTLGRFKMGRFKMARFRTARSRAGDGEDRRGTGDLSGHRTEARGPDRLIGLLEEVTFRGRTHFLEEVTLAESRRTPRGAIYEAVARFPLAGGGASDEALPFEGEVV